MGIIIYILMFTLILIVQWQFLKTIQINVLFLFFSFLINKNDQSETFGMLLFKNIDEFVAHLNFLFGEINGLIESLNFLSLDEHQEIIKVNL